MYTGDKTSPESCQSGTDLIHGTAVKSSLPATRQRVRLVNESMSYIITEESLANLNSYWTDSKQKLNWSSVFILPAWLKAWWQVFGSESEMFLRAVRHGGEIIGIAPLRIQNDTAYFIGDTDVCDYLDFIIVPGREEEFLNALLNDLKAHDIRRLDLKHLRSDAPILTSLGKIARSLGHDIIRTQEDITMEMDLPHDWDEYLAVLSTKQRHEIRRKLRRLVEAGDIDFRFIDGDTVISETMSYFFKMFAESRQDKLEFLTERMESFFSVLAKAMAEVGLLKLGVLELDTQPVAEIMCFDFDNCRYLYNSGYDPEYDYLSVGLLSKILAIKDSIEEGRERFDFLKGAETYKYRLGGQEIPLYRCQITIK